MIEKLDIVKLSMDKKYITDFINKLLLLCVAVVAADVGFISDRRVGEVTVA